MAKAQLELFWGKSLLRLGPQKLDPSQWLGKEDRFIHIIATRQALQWRVASGEWQVACSTHFWRSTKCHPGDRETPIKAEGSLLCNN
ncbi:uncharacterized protein LOC108023767 [Drosophila biarmipes]|uniref:uncharacterized protein LOC108023767 n=1 Tax=Drosophila biarmipes TaxID=125945 RepID=UPI001CDA93EA|nr:uncharacterized protein LOC108023767 [Drosophila biarmipes]